MNSKWLIGALVVSAALNVAAVGFLIGYSSSPKPGIRGIDPTAGLARLVRTIPETRREELARDGTTILSDGELRRRIRASLGGLRGSQRIIEGALAAEPFDPDELVKALARYREHFADNQASNHQAFVDILARLTPDERRRFLEEMRSKSGRREHPGPRHRPQGAQRSGAPTHQ